MTDAWSQDAAKAIGSRIRELRQARRWTAHILARHCGFSGDGKAVVLRAEAGRHPPTLATVRRYAQALGVPVYEILKALQSVEEMEKSA